MWALALAAIVIVFLAIATFVLPKLFLHNRSTVTFSADRGVRRIKAKDGESVLYEPKLAIRKYVKQYVLSCRDGKKSLVCKLGKKCKYIDYDIVVFDVGNRVHRIIGVKEAVTDKGYTRVVQLPDETAYVSLHVNEVDDVQVERRVHSRISAGRVAVFSLCSSLLIAATVAGIRICCVYLFGGLFSELLMIDSYSIITCVIIAAAVAVLDLALTLIAVLTHGRREQTKREKKKI